jgi:acetyltransferase
MSSDPSFERAPVWNGPTTVRDGACIVVRPLRPEDVERDKQFIDSLSDDARHMRFFRHFASVPADLLTRLMEIDYDKSMALVATIGSAEGERFVGVARYGSTEQEHVADFAVAVLDGWQKRGVATVLMLALMSFALDHGVTTFIGDVLPENDGMLKLARGLSFDVSYDTDVDLMRVSRDLRLGSETARSANFS